MDLAPARPAQAVDVGACPQGDEENASHPQGIVRAGGGGGRRYRRSRHLRHHPDAGRRRAGIAGGGGRDAPARHRGRVRPEPPLFVRRVGRPEGGRRELDARGASGLRGHLRRRRACVRRGRAVDPILAHLPSPRRGGPRLGARDPRDHPCSRRSARTNRGVARPAGRGHEKRDRGGSCWPRRRWSRRPGRRATSPRSWTPWAKSAPPTFARPTGG